MPDINDQIVARHDENNENNGNNGNNENNGNDGNNRNNENNGNNRNNENDGNDENNENMENAENNGNNETAENIELVQLLSVIRNEQPPPGSSIIAQVPEQAIKPKGSAKRKPTVKVSKFQNEFMKSLFLPKYGPKIARISALLCGTIQGRNPYNILFIFWEKR